MAKLLVHKLLIAKNFFQIFSQKIFQNLSSRPTSENWPCAACNTINAPNFSRCDNCYAVRPTTQREKAKASHHGRAGGFYDRQEVERREYDSDEESIDEFGRKKKKRGGCGGKAGAVRSKIGPTKTGLAEDGGLAERLMASLNGGGAALAGTSSTNLEAQNIKAGTVMEVGGEGAAAPSGAHGATERGILPDGGVVGQNPPRSRTTEEDLGREDRDHGGGRSRSRDNRRAADVGEGYRRGAGQNLQDKDHGRQQKDWQSSRAGDERRDDRSTYGYHGRR